MNTYNPLRHRGDTGDGKVTLNLGSLTLQGVVMQHNPDYNAKQTKKRDNLRDIIDKYETASTAYNTSFYRKSVKISVAEMGFRDLVWTISVRFDIKSVDGFNARLSVKEEICKEIKETYLKTFHSKDKTHPNSIITYEHTNEEVSVFYLHWDTVTKNDIPEKISQSMGGANSSRCGSNVLWRLFYWTESKLLAIVYYFTLLSVTLRFTKENKHIIIHLCFYVILSLLMSLIIWCGLCLQYLNKPERYDFLKPIVEYLYQTYAHPLYCYITRACY